ncbi:MAG: hypothetical protein JJU00_05080 [Opitutales bacterium]|nr:hypothetical protein [Opitutales bacterium]
MAAKTDIKKPRIRQAGSAETFDGSNTTGTEQPSDSLNRLLRASMNEKIDGKLIFSMVYSKDFRTFAFQLYSFSLSLGFEARPSVILP